MRPLQNANLACSVPHVENDLASTSLEAEWMDVNADGRCTKKNGPRQSILVSPRSRNGEFDACERYRVSARTDVLLLEFTSQVPFYERCLSNTAISDKQQLETRFLHRRSGRIFGSDSDGVRQITPPMRKITSREQRPNEADSRLPAGRRPLYYGTHHRSSAEQFWRYDSRRLKTTRVHEAKKHRTSDGNLPAGGSPHWTLRSTVTSRTDLSFSHSARGDRGPGPWRLGQVRSGQVRYITRPKSTSRTMRLRLMMRESQGSLCCLRAPSLEI